MLYADQDELERVPEWSGQFYEFDGEDRAIMLVSNLDERYHRAPLGWRPDGFRTSTFGEFEVYAYTRHCSTEVDSW
jgi:hypothetical protein